MITVPLNDPSVVNTVLLLVVKMIDTDDGFQRLLMAHCSTDVLEELRQRKARDLVEISSRLKSLRISFSADEFLNELKKVDLQRRDQEMYEYFVRHGASRTMLCDLWKKTSEEVTAMRRALLPDGSTGPGRRAMPKAHAVREAIHNAWAEIDKAHADAPQRQRLYHLHQRFTAYSIDTLVTTLSEFDQPDRKRRTKPADVALEHMTMGHLFPQLGPAV
jgi:hypothetical protein